MKPSPPQKRVDPKILLSAFLALLLFFQVPLSFIAFEIGFSNRLTMLALRALILITSVILIGNLSEIKPSKWHIIIYSFWGFYISRLLFDVFILDVSTAIPTWELLAWGVGASLLPSLAIYSIATRCSERLDPSLLVNLGTISLGLSSICFALNFNPFESRFLLPDLNPIPAGHAGTSLFLVSLCSLFFISDNKNKAFSKWFNLLGIIVGTGVTLSSSTRSAFISLIVGLIIVLIIYKDSSSTSNKWFISIGTIITICISYATLGGSGLINKLQTIGQGDSELHRLVFASTGLQSWTEKPLFGQGFLMHQLIGDLFSDLNHYYPHNFIIESLLLGGLVLGSLLLLFIAFTTWSSINLINLSKPDLWLVCLWMQSCIYIMFSGHLGNVPLFWFTSAAVCGRYQALTSKKVEVNG